MAYLCSTRAGTLAEDPTGAWRHLLWWVVLADPLHVVSPHGRVQAPHSLAAGFEGKCPTSKNQVEAIVYFTV